MLVDRREREPHGLTCLRIAARERDQLQRITGHRVDERAQRVGDEHRGGGGQQLGEPERVAERPLVLTQGHEEVATDCALEILREPTLVDETDPPLALRMHPRERSLHEREPVGEQQVVDRERTRPLGAVLGQHRMRGQPSAHRLPRETEPTRERSHVDARAPRELLHPLRVELDHRATHEGGRLAHRHRRPHRHALQQHLREAKRLRDVELRHAEIRHGIDVGSHFASSSSIEASSVPAHVTGSIDG